MNARLNPRAPAELPASQPGCKRWRWRIAAAVLVLVLLYGWVATVMSNRMRPQSIDRVVRENARHLALAADQYFQEHGVSSCDYADLVGPEKSIRELIIAARESYPATYAKGMTITVTGVAGARTVTYAP